MTIALIDGFDLYNGTGVNTGLQAKWSVLGGAIGNWSMVAGRFGGQAARAAGGASPSTALQRALPSSYTNLSVGVAILVSAYPTGTNTFALGFADGVTPQFGLKVNSNGAIEVSRYSNLTSPTIAASLGISAAGVIAINTWHYVEVEATINNTTGVVKVYVDGTQVLNLSAINNRNSANSTANMLVFGDSGSSTTNPQINFDDLYFTDAATKLGERRVETLYPSADTAQKDFTPNSGTANFSRVNEAQCDGDTSYVQASAIGNTDRYDFGDLTGSPATIDAVQVSAFAEKTDATARSVALQVKSGATTSDGANIALAASYAKLERLLLTDPNGGGAWSTSSVNALQAGPKVTV